MGVEFWSLIISVLALISSIAIPLWFRSGDTKEKLNDKRALLLQKILLVRSIAYMSRLQLAQLLRRHGVAMEPAQRTALEAEVPNLERQENELWNLHEELRQDESVTMDDLAQIFVQVNVNEAEVNGLAQIIEKGAKSYE